MFVLSIFGNTGNIDEDMATLMMPWPEREQNVKAPLL